MFVMFIYFACLANHNAEVRPEGKQTCHVTLSMCYVISALLSMAVVN